MNSKIVSFILTFLAIAGFLVTLSEMYTSYNVLKSSIYYLLAPVFMAIVLIIFKKYTQESIKWLNITTLSIYAFFAFIFSLIALYSSPSNQVETLPSAIFYLAGILALCNMVFIKYKSTSSKRESISKPHKAFRYILLALLLLYIGMVAIDVYNGRNNINQNIKDNSLPLG